MTESAVIDRFAAVADEYDRHAAPQQWAAADLLDFTQVERPRTVLEPGCGTGLYTRMLRDAFPDADIRAVDVCPQMLAVARGRQDCAGIEFVQADAEDPLPGAYDLITSNATFQWFRHLPETLDRYAEMLTEEAALTFSFFGPGTYAELDTALRQVLGASARVTATRFTDADALSKMMHDAFGHVRVEQTRYTQSFNSVWELLRSIKYTGTRGPAPEDTLFWTPSLIRKLDRAYPRREGRIEATYQVHLCEGRP